MKKAFISVERSLRNFNKGRYMVPQTKKTIYMPLSPKALSGAGTWRKDGGRPCI